MKKLLLATVALVALGAPALAADMAARPYTKPAADRRADHNWTGFYIGAHLGAAFGNDNTFNGLIASNNNDARSRRRAGRRRLAGRAELRDRCRRPVLLAERQRHQRELRQRLHLQQRPARDRLDHRPRRLHLGSGPALREGRLCLCRQRDADAGGVPQVFAFDRGHRDGWTVGAGLEYMFAQNWSGKVEYQYYDRQQPVRGPGGAGAVRQLPHRRAHAQAGINYRFNPAVRWLRSTNNRFRVSFAEKAGAQPAFFVSDQKFGARRRCSKSVNRVPRWCRRGSPSDSVWARCDGVWHFDRQTRFRKIAFRNSASAAICLPLSPSSPAWPS